MTSQLAKKAEATAELEDLYKSKADILRNQVSFRDTGMTFKSYADELDFAAVYPFVPYQFQLVQKVFDASRYPTAARVGAAAGAAYGAAYDPTHAFEFGLQRVLDGIAVLIQARSAQAR